MSPESSQPGPLLVLQRSDLAYLSENAPRFEGTPLLFLDPGLLDEAAVRGLKGMALRRIDSGPDFQARVTAEATALATLLDLRLTAERQRLWPGALVQGWDVGLFFLAFWRLGVVREYGARLASEWPEPRLGLLRPRVPQQMYFDSFLGPDWLLAHQPERYHVVAGYDAVQWARPQACSEVIDAQALRRAVHDGGASLLSHVPTCFYDRAWLLGEVARAHPRSVDLPSPIWDVPLHRGATLLQPAGSAPAAHQAQAQRYAERAVPVMRDLLIDLLPMPDSRERQLQAWAERCRWQALNYLALEDGLTGCRPSFLLADQDVGLNGPLYSVAAARDSAITVVPHSGYASMLTPHGRRVTVVDRAGWGTRCRTLLGQALAMRAVRTQPPAARRSPQRVKRLCLMLNAMQTEGLSYVDAPALADFHRALAPLCQNHGVELVLRAKPGAPALSVLSWLLGQPADDLIRHVRQPLPELAAECELCVVFGEPTTGVSAFLESGSLVLHVCPQHWPTDFMVSLPLIHDGVIELKNPADGLAQIQHLLADAPAFAQACVRQAAAFESRAQGAHGQLFDA
jgi:hypothetical protein